ncbi:NHL repeat-containing protein [Streptomyces sp. NPDC020707]|uniref:NHL repeat-containing protein n=1 Tax=Streptomyces sp. NPDC020707 TaxID=3365084 RepID=UPI00379D39CE
MPAGTCVPAALPLERLADTPVAAWELGRRLTVSGQVRRDPLDESGFRCGFFLQTGEIVAVHRDHGMRVLSAGRHWERRAPDVTFAAADRDGMVLTTPAGMFLRRPDGTDTALLAPCDLPSDVWPPAAAGVLGSGELVVALPLLGEVLVLTAEGRLRHRLGAAEGLEEPRGVCVDPDGTGFLVADARAHVVLHVSIGARSPRATLVHGRPGGAGKGPRMLNAPRWASFTHSGSVLIADTKNNRIVDISGGAVSRTWGRTDAYAQSRLRLWHPNGAQEGPDGTVLVAEGRGDRLLRLGADDTCTVLLGKCDTMATELIQPRGAHFTHRGTVMVADCHNGRVLEVTPTGVVKRVLPGPHTPDLAPGMALDWPRFATSVPEGTLVVDGRRRRLLCLDHAGSFRWQLTEWRPQGASDPVRFADPHHIVVTSRAPLELLVTDSANGTVSRIDRRGAASWWHAGLSDPHMALPLSDGGVLVSDTGADRLARISPDGRCGTWLGADKVRAHTGASLRQPRAIARLRNGALLIVDTGRHRVLLMSPDGGVRSLSPLLDSLVGSLFFPRYVDVDRDERTLLLSDFDNSRLVFVDLPSLLELLGG